MASFLSPLISLLSTLFSPFLRPLLTYLTPPTPQTTLLIGLDNAGKSTLLSTLLHATAACEPTLTPKATTTTLGNTTFTLHDLGGHDAVRHVWGDYIASQTRPNSEGGGNCCVVFMVDGSTLKDRGDEVMVELCDVIELLTDTPSCRLCVFVNKSDLTDVDVDVVFSSQLQPAKELLEGSREGMGWWKLFKGSAKTGEGVENMFAWIAKL